MDYESIKKLITDMGNSKLSSLQIDFPDGTKINMVKDNEIKRNDNTECLKTENKVEDFCKPEINLSNEPKLVSTENNGATCNETDANYRYIKSPMVGTFYSKPAPNEKKFIEIGDVITKGTTTCIIEAMKLMNEIEAEFDGKVVEILKQDGDPVEYGENLIKLL